MEMTERDKEEMKEESEGWKRRKSRNDELYKLDGKK